MDADGFKLTLRDGAEVVVRPIRAEDKDPLLAGFDRLSAESRYRRFLAPIETLGPTQLRYLTEVDHHDHEALIAFAAGEDRVVGVGRFIRTEEGRAEAAVTVADEWQGRGLGMALTSLLAERALEEGVNCFTALLLARNKEMQALLSSVGEVKTVAREGGTIEVEVPLREDAPGAGRGLYRVLASVGSRALDLARPPRGRDEKG